MAFSRLAVPFALGLLVTGCGSKAKGGEGTEANGTAGADLSALQTQVTELTREVELLKTYHGELKSWLRGTDKVKKDEITMHDWNVRVRDAVCVLEDKAGIPEGPKRLCHKDTEHSGPPKPPPFL
jgi:hypothetical protein